MQFFLDTADLKEIQQGLEWGMVDGITSNPSLIAKEGKNYLDAVKEIAELVPGPVSGEVLATDYDTMLEQAHKLAALAQNVVVKVPLTPDGLRACRALRGEGTKVNVTLCFSASQALLAAKAGATYISPFIGRLDDVSTDGMHLIEQVVTIYNNYDFETQVLVASARHPLHIVQSALLGADVVTMPFKVMEQLYKHPLTDVGLEKFLSDWKKTGKSFDETAVEALAGASRR
jgi:transaldolase